MRDLYKHLKMTLGLGERKTEGQQAIKDENGAVARQGGHPPAVGEVLRQSAQHQVSRTPTTHCQEGTAAEESPGRGRKSERPHHSRQKPTYAETLQAVLAMANWKAPGAGSLPVELLKLDDPTREPVILRHYHAILVRVWSGEEIEQERKDATNQGALQVVEPIRLQQLPRDFTHLPRRKSTAEDRRQSP